MKKLIERISKLNRIDTDLAERAFSALIWRTVLTNNEHITTPIKAAIMAQLQPLCPERMIPTITSHLPEREAPEDKFAARLKELNLPPEVTDQATAEAANEQYRLNQDRQRWFAFQLKSIREFDKELPAITKLTVSWLENQLVNYLVKQQAKYAAQYAITGSEKPQEAVRLIFKEINRVAA